MPGLTLEGISHAFGEVPVIDEITLKVEPGEVVCLLGPSGSGKSTLLRIAAGLETQQAGVVIIGDEVVATDGYCLPPEARDIGLMFQDYALFPHLSVLDNVAFGISEKSADRRREAAGEMLDQMGIRHLAKAYPHTLSGGEQQRVALARALAPNPGIMLMDEPFSGLDVRLRDQVRDDSLAVLKKLGTATMLVTHDPDEAMHMADHIVLMREGRVIQQGSPEELYYRPSNSFVANFFSETNRLLGTVENGAVRTPFGILPAHWFPDGDEVEVLARPRDLTLTNSASEMCAEAVVRRARLIGHDSLIEVELNEGGAEFMVRVPGVLLPEPGIPTAVRLDDSRVFIFARDGDD